MHKNTCLTGLVAATLCAGVGVSHAAVSQKDFEALKLKVLDLESKVSTSEEAAARHNFVFAGGFDANYQKTQGENGGFMMGSFNPIFLVRMGDKVLFEGAMEFEVNNDGSPGNVDTTVEFAQIDYMVNDWLTLQAGKTVLPLGSFIETTDPAWINKLPTFPLPRADATAILPESDVGAQARGGISVGDNGAYASYAAFLVNGPGNDGAGNFSFDSVENQNHSLGYGGKIGYFTPFGDGTDNNVEVGLSGESGKWDSAGQYNWSVAVADARLHYTTATEVRGEVIRSNEENVGGTIHPNGWWLQGSYKLLGLDTDSSMLNKTELVARYSAVNQDDGGGLVKQVAIGVDYLVTETLFLKGDYEINSANDPAMAADQLNIQLAYGF